MGEDVVDELALWADALRGDGDAFGLLFDLHQARVMRHARRLVSGTADAEDVTASTFLELWRRRRDVRLVDQSILPWLLVTASNTARNLRRSRLRYARLLRRLPRPDDHPDIADLVIENSLEGALDRELHSTLTGLSANDLHVITLVVLEGYSCADAADVLGISIEAAKSRLHRAKQRVRGQHIGLRLSTTPPTSGA